MIFPPTAFQLFAGHSRRSARKEKYFFLGGALVGSVRSRQCVRSSCLPSDLQGLYASGCRQVAVSLASVCRQLGVSLPSGWRQFAVRLASVCRQVGVRLTAMRGARQAESRKQKVESPNPEKYFFAGAPTNLLGVLGLLGCVGAGDGSAEI
jgi:hypothetical protein